MKNRHVKLVGLTVSVLLLMGCATQGQMYQWGGYVALLYQSYKNPEKVVEFRIGLETHIAAMEKANLKVAPGLYAELGTMYLQSGDPKKAVAMYTKEREAWPESKGLMDALIKTTEKRTGANAEVKS